VRPTTSGLPLPANGTPSGAKLVRSQYRFMELAREKAQSAPPLPGTTGGYHVRTTPQRSAPAAPAVGGVTTAPAGGTPVT